MWYTATEAAFELVVQLRANGRANRHLAAPSTDPFVATVRRGRRRHPLTAHR